MQKLAPFRFEWDAHEYEHKERSQDWFWAVGIVTVALAVAAAVFGNFIFAILVLVASFSLALFINRPPADVHVIVDERGVTRDRIHYPYSTLQSFWIDAEHSHPKLLLSSQKMFMPLIVIPMAPGLDTESLHDSLSQILEEDYHSLPLVEKILEFLGF